MVGLLGVGIHMVMVDDGRISFRFRIRDRRRAWRSGSRFFWKDAIAIDRLDHGGSSWSFGGANLRMSVEEWTRIWVQWNKMLALDVEVEDW